MGMVRRSKGMPFGIAGLTAYVKPDDNGKIDKPSEVERFLEGITDKTKLTDVLQQLIQLLQGSSGDTKDDDTINGAKAYADYVVAVARSATIYVGAGEADDDFDIEPITISQMHETLVELEMTDEYIYVLYPKTRDIEMTMSSISVPFAKVAEQTIDDVVFNVCRSENTYSGELNIGLQLKY